MLLAEQLPGFYLTGFPILFQEATSPLSSSASGACADAGTIAMQAYGMWNKQGTHASAVLRNGLLFFPCAFSIQVSQRPPLDFSQPGRNHALFPKSYSRRPAAASGGDVRAWTRMRALLACWRHTCSEKARVPGKRAELRATAPWPEAPVLTATQEYHRSIHRYPR